MTLDPGGQQLGSAARALLDAAREGMTPDAAAVKRVRAKVGAGAAAGAGTALALKLGALGVTVALAIGAVVAFRGGGSEEQVAPHVAPRIETRADQPAVRSVGSAHDEAPPPAPAIETAPATEMAPTIQMAPTSARPRPVELAREVELIDTAMSALRAGDPQGALAAIHTHERETHGAGQMAEDAAAIEIEALCRLKDPSVAAKLDAFDARFPRSAQRSRLTEVCK